METLQPQTIGLLNEKPLHSALKDWYAQPGDQFEAAVDGYVIDIVRQDLLIEIQTARSASLKAKLRRLVQAHPVRLVYPIAQEKWIVKLPKAAGDRRSRRKSPTRGEVVDVFRHLVSFPAILQEPRFSVEVLLIQEEEVRRHEAGRAWRRRGWVTEERRLLAVLEQHLFRSPQEMASLLPADLPRAFTTADLAAALARPRRVAQEMTYCLRKMDQLRQVDKRGNAAVYVRNT